MMASKALLANVILAKKGPQNELSCVEINGALGCNPATFLGGQGIDQALDCNPATIFVKKCGFLLNFL